MQLATEVKLGPVLIRINWLVVAGIVLSAAGFARLGIWQLDRASEKTALQTAMQQEQQRIEDEKRAQRNIYIIGGVIVAVFIVVLVITMKKKAKK